MNSLYWLKRTLTMGIGLILLLLLTLPIGAAFLSFVEVQKDGVGEVDGLDGAFSVAISPDGKHLYIAGSSDDAVAVFSRDETSGKLTFIEVIKDGQDGVDGLEGDRSVAISPDGKHLYVAAGHEFIIDSADDAVTAFRRNEASGKLTFIKTYKDGQNGIGGLDGARSVAISPDGKYLYVASWYSDAVVLFGRDETSGELTFIEAYRDGQDGVNGIDSVYAVTVSPDGNHLYTAAWSNDAVAAFSRNKTTGRLTYIDAYKDGQNGVNGLDGAYAVTVSPDGKHLYAAAEPNNTVVLFSRNQATGKLTYEELWRDGTAGVDGLEEAHGLIVSPDGEHLYATGGADDAIVVFSRNVSTGQLTFVEVQKDGVGGIDGLEGSQSVAISPDEKHLYVVGRSDNGVAVFDLSATIPTEPEFTHIYLPLVLKAPPTGALQFGNETGNEVEVKLIGFGTRIFSATVGPHIWVGIPPATYDWEATGTCDGEPGTVGSTQPPSSPDYREPVTILANQIIPLNQENGGKFSCEE